MKLFKGGVRTTNFANPALGRDPNSGPTGYEVGVLTAFLHILFLFLPFVPCSIFFLLSLGRNSSTDCYRVLLISFP
jgi:hypothetical protein